ncbi:MAG: serine hydrolase [Lewinellaceae bacterium]|nr:serine hydrolase [Lewinellaceae bacterium]
MRRQTNLLFCCLLILISTCSLSAQATDTTAYHHALKELVLLQNEQSRIPLQRLDTLRVGLFVSGKTPLDRFADILGRYTWITPLTPPAYASAAEAQTWVDEQARIYNFFIIGVGDEPTATTPPSFLFDHFFIEKLIASRPCAVVFFGGVKGLRQLPALELAPVLISSTYADWGQSLAAQLIFGGVETNSRTARELSASFPAGSGIPSAAANRLGFAPPEWVGMNSQLLRDSIAALVAEGLDARAYPGAQVLVAKNGKIVYHQAFGYHTYEDKQPVTTTDIYDFASVTKISSSLPVLMKWYGENRLNLDAPLVNYLPEVRNSNKADLKMRDILTHQARLMAWIPFWRGTLRGNSRYPWQKNWDGNRNNDYRFRSHTFKRDSSRQYPIYVTDDLWMHRNYADKMYEAMYKSPLNAKPGYVYSDFFFIMMPRVVKANTGESFEPYVKKNFYHPLGAYTMTFNPLRQFPAERIIPTERDTFFRMKLLHGTVHDEGASMLGGVSGHAGLFGSANDLAKLMQMYMNGGTYGGERLIAEEALKEFSRCQYCPDNYRGLGFDKPLVTYDPARSSVARDASPNSFGHTGYTGTLTWVDPDQQLLYIFFSNRVNPTRLNRKLYDMNIRPRIQQVLYDAINVPK